MISIVELDNDKCDLMWKKIAKKVHKWGKNFVKRVF